jgi:hypothetical protein
MYFSTNNKKKHTEELTISRLNAIQDEKNTHIYKNDKYLRIFIIAFDYNLLSSN